MKTIAFDIYGTLINPLALGEVLYEMMGEKSSEFNDLWRNKQLEYSFRKAAMKTFNHFSECTLQALDYADEYYNTRLSSEQKSKLLNMYRELAPYDEVPEFLSSLKDREIQIAAFSNGKKEDLISLFDHGKITKYFDLIVSVDEVKTFKPSPEVYELLTHKCATDKENIWMISSNPFDIIGAGNYGLNTVWIKRNPKAVFDPFGYQPDHEITNLDDVLNLF